MASVLDLGAAWSVRPPAEAVSGFAQDAAALGSDWAAVGLDFQSAILRLCQEHARACALAEELARLHAEEAARTRKAIEGIIQVWIQENAGEHA